MYRTTSVAHREFTGLTSEARKPEMDVDSDCDGNDAGMGFPGAIVSDKDDDISNMLLAQFGNLTEGQRPVNWIKSKHNKSAHTLEVTLPGRQTRGYAPGMNAGDIRESWLPHHQTSTSRSPTLSSTRPSAASANPTRWISATWCAAL